MQHLNQTAWKFALCNDATLLNKITLFGVVQGVGMRPFIYTLAQKLELVGFVRNTQAALEIILPAHKTESFLNALKKGLPPLALVEKSLLALMIRHFISMVLGS